jgi:hypothetical protein
MGRPRAPIPSPELALRVVFGLLLALPAAGASVSAQPASVGHLDSASYPIRVHYPTEAHATVAATVLAEAELTWEAEVVQMGFEPPMTEDASGAAIVGLWIYLVAGSEYAHGEPISDIPGTPYTDCTTRVILPADLPASYLPIYVAHESNHAMQMAVDCVESPFAYENTTVAVTTVLFPEESMWLTYFLPAFQVNPHLGIDCTFFMDQTRRYYHYGAALFQVFLDEWIGDGDGRLFPRFWRAARQVGSVTVSGGSPYSSTPNEPDLLDGIAAVLEEEGSSLHEAFVEFAVWRFFVGEYDDGAHFSSGALWTGREVQVATSHALADLPLAGAVPSTLPQDYGTTYVELDVSGLQPPMGVAFSFSGESSATWSVDALRVGEDGSVARERVPIDAQGQGQLGHGSLSGVERIVWAITALGGEDHDSDRPDCTVGHDLNYGIALVDTDTSPTIEQIDPTRLRRGQSHGLTVTGTGFLPGITAEVEGDGVQVFSVERLSATSLHVVVVVTDEAAAGPRSLVLSNPNGHQARAEDALTVVIESPKSGCGCQGAGEAEGSAPLVLLLLLCVGALFHGRRRGPAQGRPR